MNGPLQSHARRGEWQQWRPHRRPVKMALNFWDRWTLSERDKCHFLCPV